MLWLAFSSALGLLLMIGSYPNSSNGMGEKIFLSGMFMLYISIMLFAGSIINNKKESK